MSEAKKRHRKRRVKGGALLTITALLCASALVRLAVEAGPALARELDAVRQRAESPEPESGDTGQERPSREALQQMLEAFRAREEAIAAREAELEERARELAVADQALSAKLEQLVEAEQALRETLSVAEGAAEGDISRLTSVYESMKPKEAAALFEEMDPEFAAGFLSRMRPEVAAGIMAGLSPQAAYTISVVMAGRHANVPTE